MNYISGLEAVSAIGYSLPGLLIHTERQVTLENLVNLNLDANINMACSQWKDTYTTGIRKVSNLPHYQDRKSVLLKIEDLESAEKVPCVIEEQKATRFLSKQQQDQMNYRTYAK